MKVFELRQLTKKPEVPDSVCRICEQIKSAKRRINKSTAHNVPALHTALFSSSPTPFGHRPIGDSGASDTFIRHDQQQYLSKATPVGGLSVGLPNGTTISSIATGILDFDVRLPPIPAHIFRDDQLDRSLISLSDYTNLGCTVLLDSVSLSIRYRGEAHDNSGVLSSHRMTAVPRVAVDRQRGVIPLMQTNNSQEWTQL